MLNRSDTYNKVKLQLNEFFSTQQCYVDCLFDDLQQVSFPEILSDSKVNEMTKQLTDIGWNVGMRAGHKFISSSYHQPPAIFIHHTLEDLTKKLDDALSAQKINAMNNRILQIAKRIAEGIHPGQFHDEIDVKSATKTFVAMLNIAELSPILEIVYQAVMSNFDLKKAGALRHMQALHIVCNRYSDVSSLTLVSTGEVVKYYDEENTIYVAGKQSTNEDESRVLTQRSLLYGVTLFVINEVFKNNGYPCFKSDAANYLIDSISADSFEKPNHDGWFVSDNSKRSAQAIANVAQLIWLHKGTDIIQEQHPLLMSYYQDVFLPACRAHVGKLENDKSRNDASISSISDEDKEAFKQCILANQTMFARTDTPVANKNDTNASPCNTIFNKRHCS